MEEQVTFKSYVLGFVFSLALTLMAFYLVAKRLLAGPGLIASLVGLALLQMGIQLHFFFHMETEPRPKWNLLMFLFMALVLVVIVFGSLWIMYSLNYNDM
jgi:cytochrome o ubiquinol oxidase operon protein cyoD